MQLPNGAVSEWRPGESWCLFWNVQHRKMRTDWWIELIVQWIGIEPKGLLLQHYLERMHREGRLSVSDLVQCDAFSITLDSLQIVVSTALRPITNTTKKSHPDHESFIFPSITDIYRDNAKLTNLSIFHSGLDDAVNIIGASSWRKLLESGQCILMILPLGYLLLTLSIHIHQRNQYSSMHPKGSTNTLLVWSFKFRTLGFVTTSAISTFARLQMLGWTLVECAPLWEHNPKLHVLLILYNLLSPATCSQGLLAATWLYVIRWYSNIHMRHSSLLFFGTEWRLNVKSYLLREINKMMLQRSLLWLATHFETNLIL